jgi:integrase
VALRRALGYQLRGYDRVLNDLVCDLERAGAATLTIELAVAWATKPADAPPLRWKARLGIARGFARYLQTLDTATQVPPTNLLAFRRSRQAPYLYSPPEIHSLLEATDTLTPALRAATYRTLPGLLAVTGMRVGEALALDRGNVDLPERRLVIRHAKGGGRQLALHPSTASELVSSYARVRDQVCRAPKTPSFLVSTVATRPIYECVRETFCELRAVTGLDTRRPVPRIHEYADVRVMPMSLRRGCSERFRWSRHRHNQSASRKARSVSVGR